MDMIHNRNQFSLNNFFLYPKQISLKLLILILYITPALTFSQQIDYKINMLANENDITQNVVSSIVTDNQGFLWFGKMDGLYKYDGYGYETFNTAFQDQTGLSNPWVTDIKIFNDSLLVGTKNGLNFFNPATQNFSYLFPSDYNPNYSNTITSVAPRSNGTIIVGTENNLLVISTEKNSPIKVNKITFEGFPLVHDIETQQLLPVPSGLIVRTSVGVFFLAEEQIQANRIQFTTIDEQLHIEPNALYLTKAKQLLIATENESYYVNLSQYPLSSHLTHYISPISQLYENWPPVRKATIFLEDNNENLLIGSDGSGLYVYEKTIKKWRNYKHEMNYAHALKNDFIRSLHVDKSGMILIGTDAGLNTMNSQKNKFDLINIIKTDEGTSEILNVHSILEDEQQNLWIGTRGKGLFILSQDGNKQVNITNTKDYPLDHVKSIILDRKKKIWIGTQNGIFIIKNDETDLSHITKKLTHQKANLLAGEYIYDIAEDSNGNKWISTANGLYLYSDNEKLHKISSQGIFDNNLIYTIYIDKSNRIWFGTLNGLIFYINPKDYKTKDFLLEKDLINLKFNTINLIATAQKFYQNYETYSFVETEQGIVVGTNYGLFKINVTTHQITPYFSSEKSTNKYTLQSNYVYGLLYNEVNDVLWASSNKGLISYNINRDDEKQYTLKDGLQSLEFNGNSVYKNMKGELFFGGANGVNILRSINTLQKSKYEPNLVLTKLIINGEVINAKNHPELLPNTISYTQKVTLDASKNTIGLEFASLHLPYASNNSYKCKLTGIDDTWIELGHKRSINYANLPKGAYSFQLMGTNNDGVWNEKYLAFEIEVLPVWYKKWWMIAIWYLSAALIVASFIWIILKNRDNVNNLKIKEIESTQIQEIYESKLVFFTNLSHEFRTPLSLILDPFNSLMRQKDYYKKNKVLFDIIKNNVDRLRRLIDQIMDFRKFEYGKLSVRISNEDITKTISTISSSFIHHSKIKNVKYKIKLPDHSIFMFYDPDSIEKIVYNLLSNGFKAVHSGGNVSISIKELKSNSKPFNLLNYKQITGEKSKKNFTNHVCIQVKDDGIGISDNNLEKVFTRFYQDDGIDSGTGIGLYMVKQFTEMHFGSIFIKSRKNKGTSFKIILPKNDDLYQSKVSETNIDLKPNNQITEEVLLQLPEQEIAAIQVKPYTIAVVEDNDELRMYLKSVLEVDYNVYTANNGLEGLDLIKEEIPDIVISDVVMPEIDGLEMCKKIKENFETSHIPVILLTAKSFDNQIIEGINSGADHYITKPFNHEILLAKLKSLMKNREKLRLTFQNAKILEPSKITVTSIDEKLIIKLKELIEKNIQNQQLTLEMLATEVGVSRAQLFRKVKALTGLTPNNFIKAIRLKYAAQLLDNDKFQITEVAFLSGFSEASYFSRCFKENFGCSPKEYKKSDEPT
ncbi:response regulator [Aureibaculum sp. A20]|uniref:histidine kinase n=1 Tax=Aureibaculum flavum TaxID=2795986 RepID=A0ABS0WVM5_9FLAO|nr:hybrid sensor histidine kinase/response regulator transcription factor [Aureibaculum flavum]MBJ2176054.1 response regulator [Aureibaculum flavum]